MPIGREEEQLPPLDQDEYLRYSRHLILPDVGLQGQRRLKDARVLMIGAGGLGSAAGLYLAAAGVGTLGIVEADRVDMTNLQRQVLHGTSDVGRTKLASACDRLTDLNPRIEVRAHDTWFTAENALELTRAYDLVVDGTDNFATRYLVNDACVLSGRPNFYASVYRFEGQASVFCAPGGPCYRCLYPEPPPPDLVPSCAVGGVLGVVPGLVGLLQATEVLKWITGAGSPLVGRLLLIDALGPTFRTVKIHRDPLCPACGTHQISALEDDPRYCRLPSEPPVDLVPSLTPAELQARRQKGEDLDLVDVREKGEWDLGIIKGARHAPLSSFAEALPSFDGRREVVVYCRSGIRSARVVMQLLALGIPSKNLTGGILRWADEFDPSLPRY